MSLRRRGNWVLFLCGQWLLSCDRKYQVKNLRDQFNDFVTTTSTQPQIKKVKSDWKMTQDVVWLTAESVRAVSYETGMTTSSQLHLQQRIDMSLLLTPYRRR